MTVLPIKCNQISLVEGFPPKFSSQGPPNPANLRGRAPVPTEARLIGILGLLHQSINQSIARLQPFRPTDSGMTHVTFSQPERQRGN